MQNLDGLAVFVRVVEAGGFSAAARQLGIGKSAVSKQVSRLEDRLGVRLLNRTTRRLSATEAGTVYYERAARIVADVEDAECAVGALHAETRGTLRLNVPMSFGVRHLAPALADFMAEYPDITVDMTLNDRVVDLIDEGFDVAIRIARLPDSSMIARRLSPFRQAVSATPDYWREHGEPSRPEQLKDHNCLSYTYLSTGDEWVFQGSDGPIPVKISGDFKSNNGDAIRAVSLGGGGVSLSPTFIVGDDLRAGRLKAVLTDFMESDLSIYAVYPHNRHLSAKVRAFVDFMAARFGPEPDWDKRAYKA